MRRHSCSSTPRGGRRNINVYFDNTDRQPDEEREFRIYAGSQGGRYVGNVKNEDLLPPYLASIREAYPDDTITVSEVMENVVQVIKPDGTVIHVGDDPIGEPGQ
jgi:hypothetical protein